MAIVMFTFKQPVEVKSVSSFDINTLPFTRITYDRDYPPLWSSTEITPSFAKNRRLMLSVVPDSKNPGDTCGEIYKRRWIHVPGNKENEGIWQEIEEASRPIFVNAKHRVFRVVYHQGHKEERRLYVHCIICYVEKRGPKTVKPESSKIHLSVPDAAA